MLPLANDRWRAEFPVERLGFYYFTVEGWIDHFLTWHRDLHKRADAGAGRSRRAAADRTGDDPRRRRARRCTRQEEAAGLHRHAPVERAGRRARSRTCGARTCSRLMWRNAERRFVTRYGSEMAIEVDRPRAAFSTWYEMFPRSAGDGKHGTFRDLEAQLPRIAKMGFDVLYLPPIHPIGTTFRKGRNNSGAATERRRQPVGDRRGGRRTHRDPSAARDDRRLRAAREERGEARHRDRARHRVPGVARSSVREASIPSGFRSGPTERFNTRRIRRRSIRTSIPLHFETEEWQELWNELRDVFRFWVDKGVRIFRVDNPHTKPLPFWHWVITQLKRENPS